MIRWLLSNPDFAAGLMKLRCQKGLFELISFSINGSESDGA